MTRKTCINYHPIYLTFLLFFFFTYQTYSDCPIQYYPDQTVIGFINAQINNDPQKQNQQQTYIYTMVEPLSTATPDVLIAVNSIQYDIKNQLRFRVLFQPTPKFGTLSFKLLAQDPQNRWRRLQFNFLATNNIYLSANTIQFNGISQTNNKAKQTFISTIQVQESMRSVQPIVQTYISGVSLRSKISQQDLENALRQIQNLKRFSWNLALIKNLNQKIIQQSNINYQLSSSSLSNRSLTVELTYSFESCIVQSLTVSYLLINSVDFPLQNNIVYNSFALTGSLGSYSFKPLKNIDLTFLGIRGMQFRLNSIIDIQFIAKITESTYLISPLKRLADNTTLHASFFQMSTKQQFQCQNCPQSIYRFETYCLTNCPRNYVNFKNGSQSNCKYCNISLFLIPNRNTNECVCAKQYYMNTQTKQCQMCHYSCLTCQNNSVCLTCDTSDKTTKRTFNSNTKVCQCLPGYYDNKESLVCKQCHYSCQTCSGGSLYQCNKCKGDRKTDQTNKCVCGINFVQDQKKNCVCLSPNVLADGVCYSKNVANSLCNKPNMIQSVAVNGQKFCDCQKGFFMYNQSCLSCPDTFVLNQTTGNCQCPLTSYLSSTGTCISCQSMKYYDAKYEKCLCKKQYYQKQDESCIDCPDKSIYQDGKCQCVFNYYFKNGACIKCNKTEDDPNCLRVNKSQL